MTKNEKMDYLLNIIHRYPDRIYNNIFDNLINRMSWKECTSIVDELYKNNYLEDDESGKMQVTDLGRLRLSNQFSEIKKQDKEFSRIEIKDIEAYIVNSELFQKRLTFNLAFSFVNIAWLVFNIYRALH